MITIVNYGLGNIRAFVNVYERLKIRVAVATAEADLRGASKLILPGVGAFDSAMRKLDDSGSRDAIERAVLDRHIPILGICVGMQILAHSSDEGDLPGLGWIDGIVRRFDISGSNGKLQLPHMGWNTIHPINTNLLLRSINSDSRFYFLHSYYFHCNNRNDAIATTEYAIEYSSVINHKNIYGVQFHPEKSHEWGIQVLKNFAEM